MTLDTPASDAAPTRRSSRTGTTPVAASDEATSSRPHLRRSRRDPLASAAVAPEATGLEPLATVPAPMAAGTRSRAQNTPLTDADAAADPSALDDGRSAADAAPMTRRSARRAAVTSATASAAEAEAPVAAVAEPPATIQNEGADAAEASEPESPLTPASDAEHELPPVPDDAPAHSENVTSSHPHEVPPAAADESADPFEAAVRMFGAPGATATVRADASADESAPAAPAPEAEGHLARTRVRGRVPVRKLAATSFSVGVMGIVGLLAVGMTTPVEAVAAAGAGDSGTTSIVSLAATDADPVAKAKANPNDIQAYVAPAEAAPVELSRDEGYAAVTMSELAVEAGVRDTSSTYVNNAASAVQYPFPVGVPISSPYGMRWGRLHAGVDFVPGGQGAEIHAIADGVVRVATEAGASYGVHVIIDHIIDGQPVASHYAHMQYGSLKVTPGQVIHRGDIIGTVGTTGHSTGPHLHFEILLNGTTPTEPMAWMKAHNLASTVVTMPAGAASTGQ